MSPWALLSDVSTGLTSTGNLPIVILSVVAAPLVSALALFARWTMKRADRLEEALASCREAEAEAYRATLPVLEQALGLQRQMTEAVTSLAQLYGQERARRPR